MEKRKINYERLMAQEPTEYERMTNTIGQEVTFYEHPVLGDTSTIIIVFHDSKLAFYSNFFETDDMTSADDYMPFIINNELCYGYEI